jgi:hypothetical protein
MSSKGSGITGLTNEYTATCWVRLIQNRSGSFLVCVNYLDILL